MMKPYKPLLLSFLCLLMGSCDMIDYHPYDVRINGETDVNAHNIAEIEQKCKDKTTIKFVTMGDSELNGKYLNDKKDNISWSIDYTDFTKSFFKNIIRNHESEGVDFWWIDWQQHLTSNDTYVLLVI